jgi:hypothetical protein
MRTENLPWGYHDYVLEQCVDFLLTAYGNHDGLRAH